MSAAFPTSPATLPSVGRRASFGLVLKNEAVQDTSAEFLLLGLDNRLNGSNWRRDSPALSHPPPPLPRNGYRPGACGRRMEPAGGTRIRTISAKYGETGERASG